MTNKVVIAQPDDWHVHFREGKMLKTVTPYSARLNGRCIAMPNTKIPITNSSDAVLYKSEIEKHAKTNNFEVLVPCYLTENLNLIDFEEALKKNIFIGAKFYPINATTNSSMGISKIENVFPALEILEKHNKILLIHGEKVKDGIDIFDREKYFIDDELKKIRNQFKELRIILEHVSTQYGIEFIKLNQNIAGTITPHHMLLTKKDVFKNDLINPHHFCMPVVKNEEDLIEIRKAACFKNEKFFLGTDSAPHHIDNKSIDTKLNPGIFSALSALELYTSIFEEEGAINNLEKFTSVNGPNFYNLPINEKKISLIKQDWIIPEYIEAGDIKIKNFYGGKKINWKVE